MRMIFDLKRPVLALACLLGAQAGQASGLCENGNFQRVSKGWLSNPTYNSTTVYFKTNKAMLEPPSINNKSALGTVARYAALNSLMTFYKRISPPLADNSELQVVAMQASELNCYGKVFLLYQVEVTNLSWQAPSQAPETDVLTEVHNIMRHKQLLTIED